MQTVPNWWVVQEHHEEMRTLEVASHELQLALLQIGFVRIGGVRAHSPNRLRSSDANVCEDLHELDLGYTFSEYYAREDGRAIAVVTPYSAQNTITFRTVYEDGRCIVTCDASRALMEMYRTINSTFWDDKPEFGWQQENMEGADVATLWARHCERIELAGITALRTMDDALMTRRMIMRIGIIEGWNNRMRQGVGWASVGAAVFAFMTASPNGAIGAMVIALLPWMLRKSTAPVPVARLRRLAVSKGAAPGATTVWQ